jgi:hypothetical protein
MSLFCAKKKLLIKKLENMKKKKLFFLNFVFLFLIFLLFILFYFLKSGLFVSFFAQNDITTIKSSEALQIAW